MRNLEELGATTDGRTRVDVWRSRAVSSAGARGQRGACDRSEVDGSTVDARNVKFRAWAGATLPVDLGSCKGRGTCPAESPMWNLCDTGNRPENI